MLFEDLWSVSLFHLALHWQTVPRNPSSAETSLCVLYTQNDVAPTTGFAKDFSMRNFLFGILLATLLPCRPATANVSRDDSTAQVYRVTLSDGSSIVGTIASTTPDSLTVLSGAGIPMVLPRRAVVSVDRLRGDIEEGRFQRVDPNGSRLLLGPTARPLKQGEGYFAAYEIFFLYGAVGVADFLSIGGGLTLVPGAGDQVFYLAPKLAFSTENEMISGAVGLLHLNTFSGSEDGLGIVYGMGTYGTPRAGLTLGLGYSYSEGKFSNDAVLLVGGETQLSNSFKLITENWIPLGSDDLVLSFGFRFFGDNIAADLGFFYPIVDGSGISEGFPFIPWVGFAYNFWK